MDLQNYIDSLRDLLLLESDDIVIKYTDTNQTEIEIFLPPNTFIELKNIYSVLSNKFREIIMKMAKDQLIPQINTIARRIIPDYERIYKQLKYLGLEKFIDYNIENILGVWKLIITTTRIISISTIEEILHEMYLSGEPKIVLETHNTSSNDNDHLTFESKIYSALYNSTGINSPSIELIQKSMKLISMISQYNLIDLDIFNDSNYRRLIEKNKIDELEIIEYNRILLQLHDMVSDELYINMTNLLSNIRLGKNINRQVDVCKLLDSKFSNENMSANGIEFTNIYRSLLNSYLNILVIYNEFRSNYENTSKLIQNKYEKEVLESITELNKTISSEIVQQNNMISKYENEIKPFNVDNTTMKMEIISRLDISHLTERQKDIILRNLNNDPNLIQQDISYLNEEKFNELRKMTIEFNSYLLRIIGVLDSRVEDDTQVEDYIFTDANRIKCRDDGLDLFNTISKSEPNSISNFVANSIKTDDDVHKTLKKMLEIGEQEYITSLLNNIGDLYSDLLKRHTENNYIKSDLMLQRIEQALTLDFDNLDIELLDIFHLNDRKLHISRYILLDYIRKLNLVCYDVRYIMEGVDSNRQDIIVDCLITRYTIEYIKKDDQSETPNS